VKTVFTEILGEPTQNDRGSTIFRLPLLNTDQTVTAIPVAFSNIVDLYSTEHDEVTKRALPTAFAKKLRAGHDANNNDRYCLAVLGLDFLSNKKVKIQPDHNQRLCGTVHVLQRDIPVEEDF